MCEALRELMKEEFEEERNKAITEGLAQGMAQGMAQSIFDLGKEFGLSKSEIVSRIEKKLSITPEEAETYYDSFSQNQ